MVSPKKRKYEEPLDLADLEELMQNRYSRNSEKKVHWAFKAYSKWRLHAMDTKGFDQRLTNANVHDVKTLIKTDYAFALCKFITEVIKVNGDEYPPNTLKELVYSIQMFVHVKRVFWFILDRSDDDERQNG